MPLLLIIHLSFAAGQSSFAQSQLIDAHATYWKNIELDPRRDVLPTFVQACGTVSRWMCFGPGSGANEALTVHCIAEVV